MATLEGVNYNKINTEPTQKVPHGELVGAVKTMYDKHVFVGNVNAIADVIKLGDLLPKGARVLSATVKCPSLGTTGILSFGYAASSDAVEAADADGFIVAANIDAGGQAVLGKESAASAAVGKQFAAAVQPQLVFTEASDAAAGKTIEAWINYVMD